MIFNNIIASGGGAKALGLIGALGALKKYNLLDNIERYVGCSASASILLFTLLGYDLKEIFTLVKTSTQNILNNENSIINLMQYGGISKGIEYTNIIDNIIEKKVGIKYCTFIELYKKTKKTLILCITNLNNGKVIYMSHTNYPNFVVSEAIRLSCGLPFLFTPSIYYKICITKCHSQKKINRYYYICSEYDNFIGVCNETSHIIVTKNKEKIKKILFVIKYIYSNPNSNSWIITSFYKNKNITFNEKPLNYKSAFIKNKSKLIINTNNHVYFQSEITFADGAILDVFPIHLCKKFNGNTIGVTYEYKQNNSENVCTQTGTIINNNILNYIMRIKEITLDNNYIIKTNKYKSNYVSVDIPRHIGMCDFDMNKNDINLIMTNSLIKTSKYINKKIKDSNNDTTVQKDITKQKNIENQKKNHEKS